MPTRIFFFVRGNKRICKWGNSMNFSRNLKRLRLIKKESAADVAADLGISEAAYISWESGQAEPWGEHFYNLAHHFKVPIEVLLDENFDYELYLMILRARGTLN